MGDLLSIRFIVFGHGSGFFFHPENFFPGFLVKTSAGYQEATASIGLLPERRGKIHPEECRAIPFPLESPRVTVATAGGTLRE